MSATPIISSGPAVIPRENRVPIVCDLQYLGPHGRLDELIQIHCALAEQATPPNGLLVRPPLEGRLIAPLPSDDRKVLGRLCLALDRQMKTTGALDADKPLKQLAQASVPGTCVIGSGTAQFNVSPTPRAPGYLRCYNLDDKLDLSQLHLGTIYYKSESGAAVKILTEELGELLSFFNHNTSAASSSSQTAEPNARILELCYRLLGERDNIEAFERIKEENQALIDSELLPIEAIELRCLHTTLSKYGVNPAWRQMCESLEQCSEAFKWTNPDKTIVLTPFERGNTPEEGLERDPNMGSPYAKAYQYLLASAYLKKHKVLFMLLDNKNCDGKYASNAALFPISLLTPFPIHPHYVGEPRQPVTVTQILSRPFNTFKIIQESYALAQQQDCLEEWFVDAFRAVQGFCFNAFSRNVMKAHGILTNGGYQMTPARRLQDKALEETALFFYAAFRCLKFNKVPLFEFGSEMRSYLHSLKDDPKFPYARNVVLLLRNLETLSSKTLMIAEILSFLEIISAKNKLDPKNFRNCNNLHKGIRNLEARLTNLNFNLNPVPGSLADLYLKLLAPHKHGWDNRPTYDFSVPFAVRSFFEHLPLAVQDSVRFSIWELAGRPDIPNYGFMHGFDDMTTFTGAIHNSIQDRYIASDDLFKSEVHQKIRELKRDSVISAFHQLPDALKNQVYQQIWQVSCDPTEHEPFFGEQHVFDDWSLFKTVFDRLAHENETDYDLMDGDPTFIRFVTLHIKQEPEFFDPSIPLSQAMPEMAARDPLRLAVAMSYVDAPHAFEAGQRASSS